MSFEVRGFKIYNARRTPFKESARWSGIDVVIGYARTQRFLLQESFVSLSLLASGVSKTGVGKPDE